jgi:hypothetical protein
MKNFMQKDLSNASNIVNPAGGKATALGDANNND